MSDSNSARITKVVLYTDNNGALVDIIFENGATISASGGWANSTKTHALLTKYFEKGWPDKTVETPEWAEDTGNEPGGDVGE